jgi:hypothetical protein
MAASRRNALWHIAASTCNAFCKCVLQNCTVYEPGSREAEKPLFMGFFAGAGGSGPDPRVYGLEPLPHSPRRSFGGKEVADSRRDKPRA